MQGEVQNEAIKRSLTRLLDLVMLMQVREYAGDWLGCLDEVHVDGVSARIDELLDEIRPDCVGLADGFACTDTELKSAIGRYDGNVYEAIYAEARLSPLNAGPRMVGWEHLERVVDKDFLREGARLQRAGATPPSPTAAAAAAGGQAGGSGAATGAVAAAPASKL